MKKLLLITALAVLVGCDAKEIKREKNPDIHNRTSGFITAVPMVSPYDFEGHRYLVVYSAEGCGIIHAASCPCNLSIK